MSRAALAGLLPANQALAQDPEPFPRIIVSGEGVQTLVPDLAVLTLTVVREAMTAREALDANTEAMAARACQAMKDEGIADRDLQTSNFSIEPKIVYPKVRDRNDGTVEPPRIVGYTVRNSLTVRIRDLARRRRHSRHVRIARRQSGRADFIHETRIRQPHSPRRASRQWRRPIAKARLLADTAGVDLGKVIEITESARRPGPVPVRNGARRLCRDGGRAGARGTRRERLHGDGKRDIRHRAVNRAAGLLAAVYRLAHGVKAVLHRTANDSANRPVAAKGHTRK